MDRRDQGPILPKRQFLLALRYSTREDDFPGVKLRNPAYARHHDMYPCRLFARRRRCRALLPRTWRRSTISSLAKAYLVSALARLQMDDFSHFR